MTLGQQVFFDSLPFNNSITKNSGAIVVTHLVGDVNNFLRKISKNFSNLVIIPKGSSKTNESICLYSKYGYVLDVTREQIKSNPENFLNQIDRSMNGKHYVIFDMGGYFSHLLESLNLRKSPVIGIIEDTENGHKKYMQEINLNRNFKFPIISVARSSLKEPEDALVGQAISFSIEKTLRLRNRILVNKNVLVIGFGKIGAGICYAMKGRGANVNFYDIDPLRTIKALACGFKTGEKEKLLYESDLIISATGNKGINKTDLDHVKDGAYIFTATSSDDEFSECLLTFIGIHREADDLIEFSHDGVIKKINICNKGNPINFRDGAVVDKFIELVQAEMLLAVGLLSNAHHGCINELEEDSKRFIAKSWLNFYSKANKWAI